MINELYLKDKKYSTLYEYVYFENVTSKIMNKFIEVFDDKYMTHNIWQSMSKRLKRDIIIRRYKNDENKWIPRYQVFDGIIKNMKNSSKNIKNEIDITYSSDYYEKTNPYVLFDYESEGYFCTKNEPNSWICFEFKNHKIIPTHYTIRSTSGGKGSYHLMSWVIEGSLDKNNWEILSEERNNPALDDSFAVYTFQIQSKSQHQIKFIRIRSTGLDSSSSNYLYISAFEINGKLI